MSRLMKKLLKEVLWDYFGSSYEAMDKNCTIGIHVATIPYKGNRICTNCGGIVNVSFS